jgi:hypothetical protein
VVRGRDNDAGVIALTGAENLPKIALLGLGRHARGGAGALDVHAHHRRFDHARHANGLGHQRKAAAGSRAHGPATGMRRADDHIHDPDFVLHLAHHDAQLPGMAGHVHKHTRGRAHGIGGVKFYSRRDAAHGGGHIAGDDGLRLGKLWRFEFHRLEIFRGVS